MDHFLPFYAFGWSKSQNFLKKILKAPLENLNLVLCTGGFIADQIDCAIRGIFLNFKVSEYSFKLNKDMLKNLTVLLYSYFYNISLNVLRPTFFNIYNLPFLCSPNIGKIRVKVGPKTDYSSYILSSCTDRIAVFNNFFSLICSQTREKQNNPRDFLLSKYFLNNLPLAVFMQNTL